jgi:hypothetical protein
VPTAKKIFFIIFDFIVLKFKERSYWLVEGLLFVNRSTGIFHRQSAIIWWCLSLLLIAPQMYADEHKYRFLYLSPEVSGQVVAKNLFL